VRERIIRGTYPQGSRLPEQKLAEDLNVSRIPLREAIRQLEVDGFVQSLPRRGEVVWTWTARAVRDLFDVRLALEVAATGLAATRVAAGRDVADIEAALDRSHEALRGTDTLEIAEASAAFHEAIVLTTDNDLMVSLMRAVSGRVVWLFFLTSGRDPNVACEEHHELLDAIASGNPRLAEAVAWAHIDRGRAPSLAALPELT
jgi:DNA-binding GntR family transcriptional regulator